MQDASQLLFLIAEINSFSKLCSCYDKHSNDLLPCSRGATCRGLTLFLLLLGGDFSGLFDGDATLAESTLLARTSEEVKLRNRKTIKFFLTRIIDTHGISSRHCFLFLCQLYMSSKSCMSKIMRCLHSTSLIRFLLPLLNLSLLFLPQTFLQICDD